MTFSQIKLRAIDVTSGDIDYRGIPHYPDCLKYDENE